MKDLKIFTNNIEQKALDQIETLIAQPAFADCKIRIMPDVHAGAGCVIGFTANLGDKVIPNIVGVDIGCGMLTVSLGQVEIDFEKLDKVIRDHVPCGMNVHELHSHEDMIDHLNCVHYLRDVGRLHASMGTLGGGNHFIEVDADEDGNKYLIIHTGSRNLGKQVAEYYQNLAIRNIYSMKEQRAETVRRLVAEGREKEIQAVLESLKKTPKVPRELCYLEGEDRLAYIHDMFVCQQFASHNRFTIAGVICYRMGWKEKSYFHTIHNYIDTDGMVRKGAISAKAGERVLIPINMRDGCIIGIGKGNEDWNCSAPHGAGRIMSRSKAKETVSIEEYQDSMKGIYTTSVDRSTLDEAPMVYKPMNEIIANIADTVTIERIIKPIYNFKANE